MVGEVSSDSAVVRMRLTEKGARNHSGVIRRGTPLGPLRAGITVDDLEGACPGATGRVRIRYSTSPDLENARTSEWVNVSPDTDYAHQFRLTGLQPATKYHFAAETKDKDGTNDPLLGSFRTAPAPDQYGDVTFTVITGQKYRNVDHTDGYTIYESMLALEPHFIVPTGDTVYYDSCDPRASTIPIARYHWHRMYSYQRHVDFHLRVAGYWLKDDHDSYYNDGWPTLVPEVMLPLTYADGLQVFREQVPQAPKAYRTYRWGTALQVWLVEGRDFRSPNTMTDGPEKSIWGAEQKAWLKRTLLESDANWRILCSPTPIVGPDRSSKADNHSNKAFSHEGNEFRAWAKENVADNFFIVCGDRHWQYHSVHPTTALHEFSCGPTTDRHAGGSPGEDAIYHRYHREAGGFLSVSVRKLSDSESSRITFRFHDMLGRALYEYQRVKS